MPKALKHFLLQGMILLLWLLFVIFPITDTRVEAQASCVNPVNYRYLSPNPGVSWYADTTVCKNRLSGAALHGYMVLRRM